MRRRLILAVVGLVAVILVVHDVPLRNHLTRVERDRVVTALERDAFILAAKSQRLLVAPDPATAQTAGGTTLAGLVQDYAAASSALVVIVDRDGLVQAATDPSIAVDQNYINRPEVASALLGNAVMGERRSETLGQPLVYAAVPVLTTDDVIGAVRVTYPKSVVDDRVASRVRGILVVALISLALAFVSSFIIATSVVRPLRRLRQRTDAIAAGDLGARAEVDGPPEIRDMAVSFNQMAARVEQMLAEQRAFAGDASHQLRTPLTALRLRVDNALARAVDDPAAPTATLVDDLEAAVGELERLARLVEQLLALARTETAGLVGEIDIDEIVEGRLEMWRHLAEERGVLLSSDRTSGLRARAMAGALEQIIDNFVDNALDYAPEGSTIRLDVERRDSELVVSVADEGPGMTPEQRERAFDRFWRGAESQNRPGGSGLGLAIVAQLAAASGGRVELAANLPTGLVARVFLPLFTVAQ